MTQTSNSNVGIYMDLESLTIGLYLKYFNIVFNKQMEKIRNGLM